MNEVWITVSSQIEFQQCPGNSFLYRWKGKLRLEKDEFQVVFEIEERKHEKRGGSV